VEVVTKPSQRGKLILVIGREKNAGREEFKRFLKSRIESRRDTEEREERGGVAS
jgi:hypothetical protein